MPLDIQLRLWYTERVMGKSSRNLGEQLRAAIRESGLSGNKVAHCARVPQAVVSRFLRGERSITLDTASKLTAALGLELTPKPKGKRQKGR